MSKDDDVRTERLDADQHLTPPRKSPQETDAELRTLALARSGLHCRCPHCHNPIELVPDAELASIRCQSCGSDFSLTTDDDQATRDARTVAQVGHFKLIERIGMGAFGAVWKAQDAELDRTVAVKIPRAGQLDKQQQETFVREARTAAQLRHPNIVPVYEVGREGDTLYIVSEFVRGIPLSDWLTGQTLTSREAAEVCAEIAGALEHAHQQGVIHRDLKPANVMIDGDGRSHLMDFGLARREAGEITMTLDGQILGTPAYMSPEQAQGQAHVADGRSDIYSLGAMLFQMLTGELPFRGNPRMLMHQVIHDEAPSPRKLNASVPKDLETITLKCLEKDPNRRFASAAEMAAELRRHLAGEPIHSRPISRIEQGWRWCRRKPLVAGLTGAVAALVAFVAIAAPIAAVKQASLRRDADENADAAREMQEIAESVAAKARVGEQRQKELAAAEAKARDEAEELVQTNRQQLVRMNVLQGDALVERNDPARALPWYVEALRLDQGDAKREAPHRLRIATLWQNLPKLTRLWRHERGVFNVALSPDGKLAATASEDRTARIWNLETGEASPPLSHSTPVMTCAFSKDGKQLVTAGGALAVNGEIRVWDCATGKPVGAPIVSPIMTYFYATFTDAGDILSAEIPMNGEGRVRLWSRDAHQEIASSPFRPFSPTAGAAMMMIDAPHARVLERQGQSGRVVDLANGGNVVCELPHANGVRVACFSDDGSRLFTTEWNMLHVWDVATGRELAHYEGTPSGWGGEYDYTMSARFSLDSSRVTIGGNGRQVMQFVVDGGRIENLASVPDVSYARPIVSRDGRFVAFVMRNGSVRLWDVRMQRALATPLNHASSVTDALFANAGRQLVTACGDGSVRAWDVGTASGEMWRIYDQGLTRVDLTADGKFVLTFADDTVRNWNRETHDLVGEFKIPGGSPRALMSPHGGSLVAVGHDDGTAQVWDLFTRKPVSPVLTHERKHVHVVKISPDAKLLATIDVDSLNSFERYFGQANVWNIESGRRVFGPYQFAGFYSGMIDLEFSPDNRWLAISGGSAGLTGIQPQLAVVDLKTFKPIEQQVAQGSGSVVFASEFDSTSRYLVSRTGNPRATGSGDVRIWDLEKHAAVGSPVQFGDDPSLVEIDSHSRYVAVAAGSQVQVLDLKTGDPHGAPLMHDALVMGLEYSPDGEFLLTTAEDNTLRVWEAATGRRLGPAFVHPFAVREFELTDDGGVLTACGDNFARYWEFRPTDRPLEDLERMARVLSGGDTTAKSSSASLDAEDEAADWEALAESFPNDFRCSERQMTAWHDRQATNCVWQRDWLGAVQHMQLLHDVHFVDSANFGRVLCEAGDFKRGAEQFDKLIEHQPEIFQNWYLAVTARLRAGDIDGYQDTCQRMLKQFAKTENAREASDAAKLCLLGPIEYQPGSLPFELAARAMAQEAGSPLSSWIRLSKAIADYRAGELDDANELLIKLIEEPADAERTTTAKFLLAMVEWRQEKLDEARESLAAAVRYRVDQPAEYYAGLWNGRALVDIAQREAEKLITPQPAEDNAGASGDDQTAPRPSKVEDQKQGGE